MNQSTQKTLQLLAAHSRGIGPIVTSDAETGDFVLVLNLDGSSHRFTGSSVDGLLQSVRTWLLLEAPRGPELDSLREDLNGLDYHLDGGVLRTTAALEAVLLERRAQVRRWGVQRLRDSTTTHEVFGSEIEDFARDCVETGPTFADVLLEEVGEAIQEPPGSPELRAELVQVAAVALQWIEDLDRRAAEVSS